jgi:hypothetical protein
VAERPAERSARVISPGKQFRSQAGNSTSPRLSALARTECESPSASSPVTLATSVDFFAAASSLLELPYDDPLTSQNQTESQQPKKKTSLVTRRLLKLKVGNKIKSQIILSVVLFTYLGDSALVHWTVQRVVVALHRRDNVHLEVVVLGCEVSEHRAEPGIFFTQTAYLHACCK